MLLSLKLSKYRERESRVLFGGLNLVVTYSAQQTKEEDIFMIMPSIILIFDVLVSISDFYTTPQENYLELNKWYYVAIVWPCYIGFIHRYTKHFRYLKWRYILSYISCMDTAYLKAKPIPKIAGYKVQETLHSRYRTKFLVIDPTQKSLQLPWSFGPKIFVLHLEPPPTGLDHSAKIG